MRFVWGFRQPSAAEVAALRAPLAAALSCTEIAPGDVDLYVQRGHQPNAYAVGGRSVAVTAGVVELLLARRLSQDQIVAVLIHELGHHATRAPRAGLVTVWLTAPWRLATRLVLRMACGLAGRQPRSLVPVLAITGVLMAVGHAVSQRKWAVAGVLVGVATLAVLCPLRDAALPRAEERAADRYAADHGLARPLAAALRVLNVDQRAAPNWSRLLAPHPPIAQRIDALLAAPDRLTSRRGPRDGGSRTATRAAQK